MTRVLRMVACIALVGGCARASEKPSDTTAAPADSVTPAPPVAAQPAPAAPDSTPAKVVPSASTPPAPRDSTRLAVPTPTPTPLPSETVLTGKVVSGGLANEPTTSLQVEGAKTTTLTGPLEPELRRLNSATVWVAGAPGSGTPNASFAVSRYEIVSINGTKPLVGSLVARGADAWLATERDTVKLASPPAELRAKMGAKVWIIGRRTGAELTPQMFGVIREP